MQRDAITGTIVAHQGFVQVAFLTAEAEVAVSGRKRPATEADLFHEAHRIDASAYCNKVHYFFPAIV